MQMTHHLINKISRKEESRKWKIAYQSQSKQETEFSHRYSNEETVMVRLTYRGLGKVKRKYKKWWGSQKIAKAITTLQLKEPEKKTTSFEPGDCGSGRAPHELP